jgi:very-long-chain (3R)-3-hydroxyacyl-CoA dehydratase
MQVYSRLLLVWGVVDNFPHLAVQSPAYTTMLVAWSVTEVIRYSFFARGLATGSQPYAMTWLRYNTFFVLYPLGISSECILMYLASGPAGKINDIYKWALYANLAVYVPGEFVVLERQYCLPDSVNQLPPGSYTLFTHMMSQRKKVMRALKAKNAATSK